MHDIHIYIYTVYIYIYIYLRWGTSKPQAPPQDQMVAICERSSDVELAVWIFEDFLVGNDRKTMGKPWEMVVFGVGNGIYPLVICDITIDNYNVQWLYQLFLWPFRVDFCELFFENK